MTFTMNNRYEILQNELKYQTADSMAVLKFLRNCLMTTELQLIYEI